MIDIDVKNLKKSFEVGHDVLSGLSFEINAGEHVGILGANGSGKTTLFRLLTGEYLPDEGSIAIHRGRRIGLISQIPVYPEGWTTEDVLREAHSRLRAMAARLGESVHLARLSGDELILVACEAPQRGFHMTSETGTRLPVHASSQGKAILSAMPVYEAEALLRRRPLQVCTPHTVTAPEQLLAQLPAIRRGGYAEEHEEYRLGLKSVAAPIYEGDGPCRYAIGVICIAGTPAAEFASMRAAVMETAQNLSALLGHRAPGGI